MGEITVLPQHIPLVANLAPGEVKFVTKGHVQFFAVSGGFLQVKNGNTVVILADTAEFGHEIDMARAEAARDRALKLMQESYKGTKSFADASGTLQRSLARIKVAHKHRSRTRTTTE